MTTKVSGQVNISRPGTHTHSFDSPLSRTTWVSWYQKRKTNLDFTEARDSEWQWHQLGHMQVCTSLQPNNHASTPPLSFLQAGCPSCHPANSIKVLKAQSCNFHILWATLLQCWSCGNIWTANKWDMEQIDIWQPETSSRMMTVQGWISRLRGMQSAVDWKWRCWLFWS